MRSTFSAAAAVMTTKHLHRHRHRIVRSIPLVVGLLLCSSTTIIGFRSDLSFARSSSAFSSSSLLVPFSRQQQQPKKLSSSSSRLYVVANNDNNNNNNDNNNEWGIPRPQDLPCLTPDGSVREVLPNGGRISLIGAGPGDPELLTLRAARLLQDPDAVVVADRLVSPEILQLVRTTALYTARKLPGCAELAQDEIYAWCHEALAAGKRVIRLKIGDPFVFGRGGEEVLQFRQYGVEAQVIPGVSSAFSAPLLGSIPVTHRGVANQVVMTTGYGRNGTCPDLIQYHPEQTLVFLMAVGRLTELCQNLIALARYPADTPVAIVEKAGCPQQRTVVGDMTTIADMAKKYNVKPPSTIVVGKVVNVLLGQDEATGDTVTGLIQNATSVPGLV